MLGAGALLVFALPRWLRADERSWMLLGAILATASAAIASLLGGGSDGLGGLVRRDGASAFTALVVGVSAAVALLMGSADRSYEPRRGARAVALVLASACGATLAGASGDLVTALVGVTLLSLALDTLARPRALEQPRPRTALPSRRALIGPALFAIGLWLVLADTGSTRIGALGSTSAGIGLVGVALLLSALAVAASLVPFHLLGPELRVSAPPAMEGFVGVVGRLGAFVLLLRAAGAITASGAARPDWSASIALLAALTMIAGALVALARSSVRGVLAFMGVAQCGTLAVALASGVVAGPAIAFGLVVLVATITGAYAVVAHLGREDPQVEDLRGLARESPVLACAFGVLLLGFAGLPPGGGFVAKAYLFEAAIGAQLAWLVIVGSCTSVVLAACAFRLLFACLGEREVRLPHAGRASAVAVAAALLMLGLGVFPASLLDAVQGVRF